MCALIVVVDKLTFFALGLPENECTFMDQFNSLSLMCESESIESFTDLNI